MKSGAVIVIITPLHAHQNPLQNPHHFRAVLSLLVWLQVLTIHIRAWFLRLQVLALPYLPGQAVARTG